MAAVKVEGGELAVMVSEGHVELIAERIKDEHGPSMKLRVVLDVESADQLAKDLLRASTKARGN